MSDAEIKLAAVIAACGALTAGEAEIRIAASRAHSEQMARRNAARDGLAEHGDGLPDGVLRAEADAIPPADMAAKRQEAEELARTAGAGAEDAAVKLAELETALDVESDATTAVDARADYEAAAAEFSRRLEDQLVLHVASLLLAGAMRSVEEHLGGSSLARVSQTFSTVTDGAYGLETWGGDRKARNSMPSNTPIRRSVSRWTTCLKVRATSSTSPCGWLRCETTARPPPRYHSSPMIFCRPLTTSGRARPCEGWVILAPNCR